MRVALKDDFFVNLLHHRLALAFWILRNKRVDFSVPYRRLVGRNQVKAGDGDLVLKSQRRNPFPNKMAFAVYDANAAQVGTFLYKRIDGFVNMLFFRAPRHLLKRPSIVRFLKIFFKAARPLVQVKGLRKRLYRGECSFPLGKKARDFGRQKAGAQRILRRGAQGFRAGHRRVHKAIRRRKARLAQQDQNFFLHDRRDDKSRAVRLGHFLELLVQGISVRPFKLVRTDAKAKGSVVVFAGLLDSVVNFLPVAALFADRRNQNADFKVALFFKEARDGVRLVAVFVYDFEDFLAGLVADAAAVVHDAVYGSGGNSRNFSDFTDSHKKNPFFCVFVHATFNRITDILRIVKDFFWGRLQAPNRAANNE